MDEFISPCQRGFLPGRSLLANVVDVDLGAMEVSLTRDNGALFLFDFRAAFPSVAHDYIFLVLGHLGFPQPMLRFLQSLCDGNKCLLSIGGSLLPGFSMSSVFISPK